MLILFKQPPEEQRPLFFLIAPESQACHLPSCVEPERACGEGSGPELPLSKMPVLGTCPADPNSCPDPIEHVKEKALCD